VLISKKRPNDPFFDSEWFAIESLNDIGDVEIYLLKQMEELFEYWIDEFIEQEYLQKLICEGCALCLANVGICFKSNRFYMFLKCFVWLCYIIFLTCFQIQMQNENYDFFLSCCMWSSFWPTTNMLWGMKPLFSEFCYNFKFSYIHIIVLWIIIIHSRLVYVNFIFSLIDAFYHLPNLKWSLLSCCFNSTK